MLNAANAEAVAAVEVAEAELRAWAAVAVAAQEWEAGPRAVVAVEREWAAEVARV